MAGVSYCVERKEKQPAAGPGRCSIKWFINARQKEAQPGSAGREREREGQPASIIQFTLSWLCSRAHTSTRPLPLSPSLALSHFLSHTHARTLSHTDTHTLGCRGSAVCSGAEQRTFSTMSFGPL